MSSTNGKTPEKEKSLKSPTPKPRETASDRNKKKGTSGTKKNGPFKAGAIIDGQGSYKVTSLIRNAGPYAEYFVKDIKEDKDRVMRLEPIKKKKLKYMSEILKKEVPVETDDGLRSYLLECIEYGVNVKKKSNFIILNAHHLQLVEVQKALAVNLTPDCSLNIALQTLEAIKVLHNAGYINRNIKPATFSIGYGSSEHLVYMGDFRITRKHIDDTTKKPREARPRCRYLGTVRYSCLAALLDHDQGRKDDLESWLYMVYDFFDMENGIFWKYLPKPRVIKAKEDLKNHKIPQVYKVVPEEFKKILDLIHSWKYETEPDYKALKTMLEDFANEKKYDTKCCDWLLKVNATKAENAIELADNKSEDNMCSGFDDFEYGNEKKKSKPNKKQSARKILSGHDSIKNGRNIWTVVSLLGSGGFGDVYKVYNEQDKRKKHYALKTESEDGKKIMLRLKVEMQVLMAIQEFRKQKVVNPCKHFVELIDRGKSEELKFKFIVMTIVGPSLDDCRKKYHVDLSNKSTPYNIAQQTLEGIRDLHQLNFLHRDIKPANFAVGIGDNESLIYMLDFGICRSFVDPTTKQIRAPRTKVKFLGTVRYASRSCMRCEDQGRKDDLECWLYMIFDIIDDEDGIPWRKLRDREKIITAKSLFFKLKLEVVYENISTKMKTLVTYIDSLEYQSIPDYQYILNQISKIADHVGHPIGVAKAEWLGKLKNLPAKDKFGESDSSSSDDQSGSGDD